MKYGYLGKMTKCLHFYYNHGKNIHRLFKNISYLSLFLHPPPKINIGWTEQQSWKSICRLFFLCPLPPYTMLADLCRSCSVQPTLILGVGGGGGDLKIVTNMRNEIYYLLGSLQQFVIIFKKSTDIFSMIVFKI